MISCNPLLVARPHTTGVIYHVCAGSESVPSGTLLLALPHSPGTIPYPAASPDRYVNPPSSVFCMLQPDGCPISYMDGISCQLSSPRWSTGRPYIIGPSGRPGNPVAWPTSLTLVGHRTCRIGRPVFALPYQTPLDQCNTRTPPFLSGR